MPRNSQISSATQPLKKLAAVASETLKPTKKATVASPPLSRKRLQTRTKLIAAAATLFAEKGIAGTSLEEISEAAGFTRGALYSNFTDKTDLLLAVVSSEYQKLFDHLDSRWKEVLKSQDSRSLEQIVAEILASLPLDRNTVLFQLQLDLTSLRTPEIAAYLAPLSEQFEAAIGRYVRESLADLGRVPMVADRELGAVIIAPLERLLRQTMIRDPRINAFGGDVASAVHTWLPQFLEAFSRPL